MQVLLLCGGRGVIDPDTRMRIPKGMMMIGDRPLLWHVMKSFASYGHTDFLLALGEGDERIRNYFLQYGTQSRDIEVALVSGSVKPLSRTPEENWNVRMVDTGINAQTGSRVARCQQYLGADPYFISYSDCLSDVNLASLLEFHRSSSGTLTVTGVQPPTRFGTFVVDDGKVKSYSLGKPLTGMGGYINGGYIVAEHSLAGYMEPYSECSLENEVFTRLATEGKVAVYPHTGYWQSVDTERDLVMLNDLHRRNLRPWLPKATDFKED
ncbi:MAG: sugar phosphate nucleotidyltransferase [Bacteroidetes bacterium]|nr:sugar phosphate nucleotidyltransferase [Bacteroidota bacterium]